MNQPETRLRVIFAEAIEIDDAKARDAYLSKACGADHLFRHEIEELLLADAQAGDFLPDQPQGSRANALAFDGARVPSATGAEKIGDRIGRYKLRQKIGEGGCGIVYLAEQEEPVRRKVALKVIKLGMDTRSVVARFEVERQALALMDHPHIAKVLDGGATESGRPYFVMELVHGDKITQYCDQQHFSTRQRLELFVQVCHAVQHAHQKGVIHRDLKPSNILVTERDGAPVSKVIDFGIAKAACGFPLTDKTLFTAFEQFIGTPAYMSPEQARLGELDIDTRSDIYSLGVLLYELLAGQPPFDATWLKRLAIDEVLKTIRETDPPSPSNRLRAMTEEQRTSVARFRQVEPPVLPKLVRGDLDWIVMKCLEKDRTRRYETANELAMDLQRHLKNDPVVARPPKTGYRLQKAWRRNRLAFTAGLAVVAALVVGIGISVWQAVVATQAKTDARRLLYTANMNLAQEAWDQNKAGRLQQLLEETQTSPDRGFEWFYWERQANAELKTLRGHLDPVESVAFSPDGRRIITGSDDNTAKVWEAATGQELLNLKGHSVGITSAAFSPDGQRIVTGSRDKSAKVWEAASGKIVLTLQGHDDRIHSVAFSPNSRRIVTGSWDATAKIWDATSGHDLLTLRGHKHAVWSVAFSPDGQRIVTGSVDGTAKVWESASGKELLTIKGHKGEIRSAAFSPDGQRIVTGSWDETAKLWEASSGRELLTLTGHRESLQSVAFSPDGQRIVTGSGDATAKVWDAATGQELLTLQGHTATITGVAFSPDGRRIATSSGDLTAKVWEVASGKEPLVFKGNAEILAVAFSPDGQRIVSGSKDKTARVWEAASGRQLLMFKGNTEMLAVAFSPDGQRIVTGSHEKIARVWEVATGKPILALQGHLGEVRSAVFSPDGRRILTGSYDKTAKVWDAASGKLLLTLHGHSDDIASVAFSPDGRRIVTGSHDKTAKVWDAVGGKELLTLKGHSDELFCAVFSPDGQRIVTGGEDHTAKVWEAASGKELLTLKGHGDTIACVAFSPDGRRIVTGSWDMTAKMWEVRSGKELLTLKGHRESIQSVAFSPDGQRIVTGSYDHTARVWEAATPKQVADSQEEKLQAEQLLAGLKRQRAAELRAQAIVRARDSIKQWLILAPIPLAPGQREAEGLDFEQISEERQLRPTAGQSLSIGDGELKWSKVSLANEVVDFNAIMGQFTEHSVAYAVCYIWSESAQRGLQMRVGSDDQAKVYLNQQEVYKSTNLRSFVAEQDTVQNIALNAGLNVLVFKVVNETADWQGAIRFVDALGNPVTGIKVSLNPEAMN